MDKFFILKIESNGCTVYRVHNANDIFCLPVSASKAAQALYELLLQDTNAMVNTTDHDWMEQNRPKKSIRQFATIGEVMLQYLRDHPDEIEDMVKVMYEEYLTNGGLTSFIEGMQIIASIKQERGEL